MEIRIQSQMTLDGYIACHNGIRDWYLNPKTYGIDDFFEDSTVILDCKDEQFWSDYKSGETFWDDDLETALKRADGLDGYLSLEVTPRTLDLAERLMESPGITEFHCFLIPVTLGSGIHCSPLDRLIAEMKVFREKVLDGGVRYTVYRMDNGSAHKG